MTGTPLLAASPNSGQPRLFTAVPFANARRFSEGIFQASQQGAVDIEHVTPERFSRAWRLRLRCHDKARISFTDLTSFVVMHELRLEKVLTGDAHFSQTGMGFVCLPGNRVQRPDRKTAFPE
ncbi:MAG TPA: hypothetical protein VLY24_04470 [Bryobacteraceae bacterium]|nr:hypothetical protein [Bryobacteraceae bacterium]